MGCKMTAMVVLQGTQQGFRVLRPSYFEIQLFFYDTHLKIDKFWSNFPVKTLRLLQLVVTGGFEYNIFIDIAQMIPSSIHVKNNTIKIPFSLGYTMETPVTPPIFDPKAHIIINLFC